MNGLIWSRYPLRDMGGKAVRQLITTHNIALT